MRTAGENKSKGIFKADVYCKGVFLWIDSKTSHAFPVYECFHSSEVFVDNAEMQACYGLCTEN